MFVQRTHKQFLDPQAPLRQDFKTLNCRRSTSPFRYGITFVRRYYPYNGQLSTARMSNETNWNIMFEQTMGLKSVGPRNHSSSSELHQRFQDLSIKRLLSVVKLTIYVHKQTDKSTSCSCICKASV